MTETSSRTGYRWIILTLIFFATTINYIDRQILALLKPVFEADFGWTNTQFGYINGAFQLSYAVGLFFFGGIIDRFGIKKGYAISIVAWSAAAGLHALVTHTWVSSMLNWGMFSGLTLAGLSAGLFCFARVLLGLGESGNFPAAIKGVAQWFPLRERAFATSLFNSGANVGAILAPATIPVLAAHFGWQSTFLVAGALGFVWVFFWQRSFFLPKELIAKGKISQSEFDFINSDQAAGSVESEKPITWGEALKRRQTWSFIVAKLLTDPVWWFFLTWLPAYMVTTRGLDLKSFGMPLVAIYVIVTVLSIAGGWLSKYLINAGVSANAARKLSMILFALCVIPIFFADKLGLWGAVAIIGLAGAAHQAWSANLFTTVSDMFPKRAVGTVVGIGGMAGSVGGFFVPIVAGKVLDHYKLAGNESAGYTLLFSVCAFAYIAAFALNHILAPKFKKIEGL